MDTSLLSATARSGGQVPATMAPIRGLSPVARTPLDEFQAWLLDGRIAAHREDALFHLLSGKSTTACRNRQRVLSLAAATILRLRPERFPVRDDSILNSPRSSGYWDILVVSHEIGHNFGSPSHPLLLQVPSGNPEPGRCMRALQELWPGLQWPVRPDFAPTGPGSGAGDRSGTIMSYCHLIRTAGYGNIALTFGALSQFLW